MEKEILKILNDYKVIGDNTYGLGYKDSEELVDKIIQQFVKIKEKKCSVKRGILSCYHGTSGCPLFPKFTVNNSEKDWINEEWEKEFDRLFAVYLRRDWKEEFIGELRLFIRSHKIKWEEQAHRKGFKDGQYYNMSDEMRIHMRGATIEEQIVKIKQETISEFWEKIKPEYLEKNFGNIQVNAFISLLIIKAELEIKNLK